MAVEAVPEVEAVVVEAVAGARSAEVVEAAQAAEVEWEVEDAEADTAGLRCREEATVAAEEVVRQGPRSGPVVTAPAGWLRTGT